MYPKNAASPPRIAIGPVVQISDGAVQTGSVSIKVRPEGESASAGGGTTAYEEGVVLYTPTQAETNYSAFAVIAYKTGCIPATQTIVTTNDSTAGQVKVGSIVNDAITAAAIATGAIDADAIATDAVTEIQTGLATSAEVGAIGSGTGAALNFAATADNTSGAIEGVSFVGTANTPTTFSATAAEDGTRHSITDSGGTPDIDIIYQFAVGAGRNAAKVVWKGYVTTGDTVTVQAFNGSTWDTRATIAGSASTTNQTKDIPLLATHTGTGTNAGRVLIRFTCTGMTSVVLHTDELLVAAVAVGMSVGYANGALWVKATGTSGTTPYVNGTADNPAPWADIKTLNTTLGLNRYTVTPGTTVTLDAALTGSVMTGRSYGLALGSQNISSSYFEGVESLSGTGTTATGEAIFVDCHAGTVTLGEFDFVRCHLHGTITMSAASKYYRMHDCTGIESATVEFGAATQTLALTRMSGAITVTGMTTGDTLLVDGDGVLTLGATCNGGTVHISGNIELTNSGSGQTITYGATALGNMAHGGAAATITAERIIVASSTLDEPAVKLTGNGTGAGILAVGGVGGAGISGLGTGVGAGMFLTSAGSGIGLEVLGGAAGANATKFSGTSTQPGWVIEGGPLGGYGMQIYSNGNDEAINICGCAGDAPGIVIEGHGSGPGLKITGGADGHAMQLIGGATSGDGANITHTGAANKDINAPDSDLGTTATAMPDGTVWAEG